MTDQSRSDIYGSRARIGYTSPPLTTEVFPYEFYKIVPAGVTLVVTSLAIVVRSKDEVDQSYDISMRAAREMAAAGCDIVVLGGVPINLSRGTANAEQIIRDLEAELKVKVSTSTSAQAAAAKALGCKKVVVAHPYETKDTERIAGYPAAFRLRGFGRNRLGLAVQPDRPHSASRRHRHGPRADETTSWRGLDPVSVAALADCRRARRAGTRVRRELHGRPPGDRLGCLAPLRYQGPHRGIWAAVPGVLALAERKTRRKNCNADEALVPVVVTVCAVGFGGARIGATNAAADFSSRPAFPIR